MIAGLVRRGTTVFLVALCIFIFGLTNYITLPREASPDVKIPVVMVTTPYVGVSPEDVESLVTNPIESELSGVKDLKKMSSTSAEGISLITLEFEPDAVIEDAIQKVRDRVSRARPDIPQEAEETSIAEVSFSDFPIIIVTIAGPIDQQKLKKLGEDLQDDLEDIPGVLDAKLTGGREREIRIQVDPVRLDHYGLALSDISKAIRDENVNVPGGDVTVRDTSVLLRVPGEFVLPSEIEGVAIKRRGGRPVFIRDVANVIDDYADRETYARMNGQLAVSVAVSKRTGANILEVADAVKAVAAKHMDRWPEGVGFRTLGDQSKMISSMVSDLENGILTALILVVGVLVIFMGVRASLFVALSIPLSFLLSMIVISAFGMTLNMIVLFSLILALGMLVDNAIVLVENIYRHLEMGKSVREASIAGTREIAIPVAASTATTVVAFAPLVFWTGVMGEFMGYMPKTIIIVLISSLVVAVGILPVATSMMMKKKVAVPSSDEKRKRDTPKWMGAYQGILVWSIRHRYLTAFAGAASLVVTVAIYAENNYGTEFFPETDPNRATIGVRAPDGTDLQATDAIVRKIEAILAEEENVDVFVAETGVSGGGDPMTASQPAAHFARITVDFLSDEASAKPGEKVRIEPTTDTVDRIRKRVAEIPGALITVEKERMGPPIGSPIAVEVTGSSFHEVGEFAAIVRRQLTEIEGATDLSDNYRVGRPELRLRIDRGAAKRVGMSTQDIATTIRTAVAGNKASTLRDGEDEYDIMVELDPRYRGDLQAILDLRMPGKLDTDPDTFPVPLSTVASYELAGGNGSIRHIDQDLIVTIEGDIAEGHNENDVRAAVMAFIDEADTPAGFGLRLGGAQDEQKDAQDFLSQAFLIAIFLISLVLVTQFNRFDLPFIILASVVLSLVGVLWGLMITRTPFGVIMTGLGVISLAGVVVNNAIVLLDYVEQLKNKGLATFEALVEAGSARFRPVMLTATTTVLGLVPMALGLSIDFRNFRVLTGTQSAQMWGAMAVAVIFGLAFATVLTLILVPTMYSILDDVGRLRARIFSRKPKEESKTAAGKTVPAVPVPAE
ncbi:MAG: efflux RND transporter permease subunit [Nannocystaceae bacterium]|nr:efflux RND transporter permease subunit [Nannocystaceae bacterium]